VDKPRFFGDDDVCALFPDGRFGRFRSFVDPRLRQAALVSVLCHNNQNPLEDLLTDHRMITVSLGDAWVHMALLGFNVFEGERHSRSAGSQAVYLAQSSDRTKGWLVQHLPAWARTSWHLHTKKTELVVNLAGSCFRGQGVETETVPVVGCSYLVLPTQWHFLCTEDSPAINLLMIADHDGEDPLNTTDYTYRYFTCPYPPTS